MIIKNVINALIGQDWKTGYNNSQASLNASFMALAMTVPCGLLIAKAILTFNANTMQFPLIPIALTLFFIALVFPILALVFPKALNIKPALRDWIIIRNWAFFLVMAGFACFSGLYLLGVLPFSFVYFFGLGLYLASLAIDIRLAQNVAGIGWTLAVLFAILVSVLTMLILLAALGQSL